MIPEGPSGGRATDEFTSREAAARAHEVLTNPERLRHLRATRLLDAPTEEAFDRLTRLASKLLSAPLSTVTLVDDDRQFYMSCTGFPEPVATLRQTPLEFSFCRHTVVLGKPLIISDVRGHPLVGDNPAISQFGVTAYAGIPLLTGDGHALGTLCVMDFEVRDWTEDDVASLTDLAAAVSTEIELRMDIQQRVKVERELQHALRMRDEVLGVVSHDLRNPVHTVSLTSGLLLELLETQPDPEKTRQQLNIILRAARQMDGLIRDLLDAASIGSGHLSVQVGRQEANGLLEAAADGLRPIVEDAGLRLDVVAAPGAPCVLADADRILQLLSNLVGNAVRFTPPGGVIRIAAQPVTGGVQFSVSDTGTGIPQDELTHIFERFWRPERRDHGGAGLGLAISKGIVEAHNGQLTVESRVGEGSAFFFTLPEATDA